MDLDGGLGDVVEKGTAIFGDSNTKLGGGIAATRHANGSDYWIVTHSLNSSLSPNKTFYVFLVSPNGTSSPSVQDIGISEHEPHPIEISPNGDKIVYGQEIFNFDNATGLLSSPLDLGYSSFGYSFSPDGALLYTTDGFKLYQYDLSSNDILGSRITIYNSPNSSVEASIGDLQLGPNCKIYVINFHFTKLGVINLANVLGLGCSYVPNAINYYDNGQGFNFFKFPNYIESEFDCQYASIQETSEKKWNIKQTVGKRQISVNCNFELTGHELSIFDLNGKLISRYNLNEQETTIDVVELEKGIYFATVSEQPGGQKIIIF